MAFGVIRLPRDTFGVLSSFSGYFLAPSDFGLYAAAFGVMGGSLVELELNEQEEFCEVGCRPAFDGLRQSFWNHERTFTSSAKAQAAFRFAGKTPWYQSDTRRRASYPRSL